jgi:phenylacetate-CoA ligase
MNNSINAVYHRLPAVLQDLACTAYGYVVTNSRADSADKRFSDEAWRNFFLTPETLKKKQSDLLSAMFTHAKKSSFWNSEFEKYRLDIAGDPFDELQKLPIYEKHTIRDNADRIVIGNYKKYLRIKTSGSTGAGLRLYETKDSQKLRWAYVRRFRQQIGISGDFWCGYFCGRDIVSPDEKKRFYRFNYYGRQIVFSAYHLSKDTVASYIRILNQKKPEWIHGYPSFLSELCVLANEVNISLEYAPRMVTTSSETLSPSQDRMISSFFQSPIKSLYSLTEGVVNATQINPNSDQYMLDEAFAYVEFIPHDEDYRIIGTNLTNFAFPIFRYDTGDLASRADTTSYPRTLMGIDGRRDDFVILPNGSRVGRLDHIFKEATFVNAAQIVQTNLDSITVKIVKNPALWNDRCLFQIEREFRQRLGRDIDILIELVESLEKTANGKVRLVISKLN